MGTVKRRKMAKIQPGQVFGRLSAIEATGGKWKCQCACGRLVEARAGDLNRGNTKSCGCLKKEASLRPSRNKKKNHPAEYAAWQSMKDRCSNKRNRKFDDYGGRGIDVCPEWKNNFDQFFADMGPRPSPQHSLDRQDNSRGYEPGNCRWATRQEQARNRRSVRMLTGNGETLCMSDWAERVGITAQSISYRLKSGWSEEEATTKPRGKTGPKRKAKPCQ